MKYVLALVMAMFLFCGFASAADLVVIVSVGASSKTLTIVDAQVDPLLDCYGGYNTTVDDGDGNQIANPESKSDYALRRIVEVITQEWSRWLQIQEQAAKKAASKATADSAVTIE